MFSISPVLTAGETRHIIFQEFHQSLRDVFRRQITIVNAVSRTSYRRFPSHRIRPSVQLYAEIGVSEVLLYPINEVPLVVSYDGLVEL